MKELLKIFENILGNGSIFKARLIVSIIIITVLWITKIAINGIIIRHISDIKLRHRWRRLINYIMVFLGLVLLGDSWFNGFSEFLTFFSAGLAIALKDPIVNIFGWFFIVWRRPFEIGDRIQIGDSAGDVIDVRIFEFTIMEIGNWVNSDQSTGRMVHIPNGKIFVESLANYNRGFQYIWNEIEVMLTFESNWRKAKLILQKIADKRSEHLDNAVTENLKEASKKYMIFYKNLTPIVYTKIEASGVVLTIRYLCKPQRRRTTTMLIWEDILDSFGREKDIDFAYPTMRFYNNKIEGKEGYKGGSSEKEDNKKYSKGNIEPKDRYTKPEQRDFNKNAIEKDMGEYIIQYNDSIDDE